MKFIDFINQYKPYIKMKLKTPIDNTIYIAKFNNFIIEGQLDDEIVEIKKENGRIFKEIEVKSLVNLL